MPAVLKDLPDKCIVMHSEPETDFHHAQFNNLQEFSDSVTTSLNVDISAWGGGLQASTSYKTASKGSKTNRGATFSWTAKFDKFSLSVPCKRGNPIEANLLKAWNNLPSHCKTKDQCKMFYDFSDNFGTHVITDVFTGAKVHVSASCRAMGSVVWYSA
jgi:hypothetical protein